MLLVGISGAISLIFYSSNFSQNNSPASAATSTYSGTNITVYYDSDYYSVVSAALTVTSSGMSTANWVPISVLVEIVPFSGCSWDADEGVSAVLTVISSGESISVELTRSDNVWSGTLDYVHVSCLMSDTSTHTVTFDSSLVTGTPDGSGTGSGSESGTGSTDDSGIFSSIITSDFDYTIINPYKDEDNNNVIEEDCGYDISGGSFGWVWSESYGCVKSSNEGVDNSYSGFALAIDSSDSGLLSFTYTVDSEEGCDGLIVYESGDLIFYDNIEDGSTEGTFTYEFSGGETFEFYYIKDGSSEEGADCAYISSIKLNSDFVSFSMQGGSGGTEQVGVTSGASMPSITIPTRPGYTFGGYYTSTDGNGTQYYTATGASARICDLTGLTYLYAKWTGNPYTITLNNQSATTAGTTSVTATCGSAMPTLSTLPTKTGYKFGGYYTSASGGGTRVYNADGTPAISVSTFTENTTLYARWVVVVPELLIDPTSAISANPFNEANLTTLFNMINNNTTGGIDEIKSTIEAKTTTVKAITASDLRTNTQGKSSGQGIVVTLGGLDWIVTFVSLDTSGNVIATLWLNDNYQSKWASESDVSVGDSSSGQYKITSGKLTSTWSSGWRTSSYTDSVKYPSNMYGTSYMRAVTLNNGGVYATSDTALSSSYTPVSTNKFALYTMDTYGLTNYIATPSQMSWMINRQNPSKRNYSYYWFNNESLTSTNTYGYSATKGTNGWYTYNSVTYCYESKDNYSAWGSDKLWLPSMAETGYSDTYSGLWSTNTVERSSSEYSWSRSADYDRANYSNKLYSSGSNNSWSNVSSSEAVRPALLLNLTSAASNAVYPGTAIILNDAGGTGGVGSITVSEGDNLPTLSALPTKTGYTFGGYWTGTNGTGTQYYTATGASARTCDFTSDTTLYAYWIINRGTFEGDKVLVLYDAGSFAISSASATKPANQATVTVSITIEPLSGYVWATDSGVSCILTLGIQLDSTTWSATGAMSIPLTRSGNVWSGSKTYVGQISYQASIKSATATFGSNLVKNETYNITLNANGGTINNENVTEYTYRSGATLPTDVTRTGYTFGGWYDNQSFLGSAITNISATDTGDKVYYAKWNATISVSTNLESSTNLVFGGGVHYEGESVTLVACSTPDHVFSYWLKDGVKFDGNDENPLVITVTANATYTAVFKEAGTVVDGFPVMATTGGYAQMLGQNASEIADADTITVSTYVTDTNYEFVGWYLDNDRTNCLSTAYSCRIAKSVAYKHTLVAVYKLKTETGTNGQTGN